MKAFLDQLNLRTLLLMRSLTMLILPLWFIIYRSAWPRVFLWFLVLCPVLLIAKRLDRAVERQMDECAQGIYDKLTHHAEYLTYILSIALLIFLTQLPRAENPGSLGLIAAQILAWGLFGIYLFRGIAFWVLDRREN